MIRTGSVWQRPRRPRRQVDCGASRLSRRTRCALLALALLAGAASAGAQVWQVGEQGLVSRYSHHAVDQFGQVLASGDFNGDGFRDLAIGSPRYDSTVADVGSLEFYFGGPGGLSPFAYSVTGGQADMLLGAALAAGDFDGDGEDELAVGAPGWDISTFAAAGRVYVFDYNGSSFNLSFFEQGIGGVPGTSETGDQFGEVLAVGDFDDDNYEDLAIGVPHEDVVLADSGGVMVLRGSASGLTSTGAVYILQSSIFPPEQAGAGMGQALAAGDFNGDDGYYDLAVGAPAFDVGGVVNAGLVAILLGGPSGLTTSGLNLIDDAATGGTDEAGDNFGYALATGDFTRTATCWFSYTCRTDLAIGVPGQTVSGQTNAGKIVVGYGDGLPYQTLNQGDLVPHASSPEQDDRFGQVLLSEWLESSLLNGTENGFIGADNLVIGVPSENWVSTPYQGIVQLVFGGATGLNMIPGQYRIADPGLSSYPPAAYDNFGYALALGRFNSDYHTDLAISVVGRDVGGVDNAGMVQVMYGAVFADGFESGGSSNWSNTVPSSPMAPGGERGEPLSEP